MLRHGLVERFKCLVISMLAVGWHEDCAVGDKEIGIAGREMFPGNIKGWI